MVNSAVIGCGDVSSVHLAAITGMPGAELVGVCDTDSERLQKAASGHGVPGFEDHHRLFREAHPDVVHICTPHFQHASIAIDALDAGVNVILEKPLAHSREEGERLIEAAERSSARIAVCFQNRYNVPVRAAYDMLRSGELGEIRGGSATVIWERSPQYYRNRPWRGKWATSGGGLLMNQAIHTVDLLQWLVGPVARVRGGAATRYLDGVIEVEDTADMVLDHRNGARSVFYATLANAVNAPVTLDIVTERAKLSLRGELTVTYDGGRTEMVTEPRTATGERSYWGISHEALIGEFYDQLGDSEPFWISPREAAKSLDIIQDVYDQSFPDRLAS